MTHVRIKEIRKTYSFWILWRRCSETTSSSIILVPSSLSTALRLALECGTVRQRRLPSLSLLPRGGKAQSQKQGHEKIAEVEPLGGCDVPYPQLRLLAHSLDCRPVE